MLADISGDSWGLAAEHGNTAPCAVQATASGNTAPGTVQAAVNGNTAPA